MNLTLSKMLNNQKKLDKAIYDNYKSKADNPICEGEVELSILTGLFVELGEFINETANFKYWKLNKIINKDNVLEELADVIHMCLSIMSKDNVKIKIGKTFKDLCDESLVTFKEFDSYEEDKRNSALNILENEILSQFYNCNFLTVISCCVTLAYAIGCTYEEIEKAYLDKYEKNFDRIKNNY